MEWYWIVAIIAAFIGILIGFYFLSKRGVVSADTMKILRTLLDGIGALVDSIKSIIKDMTI